MVHANIAVRRDDLSDGNILRLLQAHRDDMLKHSPPESVHALDQHQLQASDVTFWAAWLDTQNVNGESLEFAGCGALKDLGGGGTESTRNAHRHAELKSMKTEPKHVRKGVARALLVHIIAEAKRRGFTRLSLETGTQDVFIPARRLYQRHGFEVCEPFAAYKQDPLSVCMTLSLV